MFTPEFRNRLDAIIAFANLTPEIVGRVVDKFVMQLEAQLADRNVTIELSDAARDWLAKKGYDPLFGARPLGRVIQEHIKKPLAEELLFGKLEKGGIVDVDLRRREARLRLQARPHAQAPRGRRGRGRRGRGRREGARARDLALRQPPHPEERAKRASRRRGGRSG